MVVSPLNAVTMDIKFTRAVDYSFIEKTGGVVHPKGFGVMLCTAGSCRLSFDDRIYTVEPNMLFIFKPFSIITLEFASPDLSGRIMGLSV